MGFGTKRGHRWLVFAMFAGLALATSPARAERPNAGSHNEGICDGLSDATPGLESLCVNYCEARDCANSDDPECDELLANYDRRRSDGDPEMPCLVTCPCFTAADIRNHPAELTRCIDDSDGDWYFSALFDDITTADGVGATSVYSQDFHVCGYTDFTFDQKVIWLLIEPAEAEVCRSIVGSAIVERGLSCD